MTGDSHRLDLTNNVFQLHGVDEHGVAVLRKQLRHDHVLPFFTCVEPCLVGIEPAAARTTGQPN